MIQISMRELTTPYKLLRFPARNASPGVAQTFVPTASDHSLRERYLIDVRIGVMASIKGNRMVLSGTEELHEQISKLKGQVQDLKKALSAMQAEVSSDPHPLLQAMDKDQLQLPPNLQTSSQPSSSPASTSSSSKSSAPGSQASTTSVVPVSDTIPKLELPDDIALDAYGMFDTKIVGFFLAPD